MYPIYIPSRGRAGISTTANVLNKHLIPFSFVVEPSEKELYKQHYPDNTILTIEKDNSGSVVMARNFCKTHARNLGAEYHWQIDDNINSFGILNAGKITKTNPLQIFTLCETFVHKYKNIGIAGLSHTNFAAGKKTPISINKQVFSCVLVDNKNQLKWRDGVVEDTDYSLQVLSQQLCTVKFNVYVMEKKATMSMKGGNTDTIYQGDGRLNQARGMERYWPYLFTVVKKGDKPRVSGNHIWKHFTHPLIAK